jgi:DNA invertase Pin-like site-specific DNA recombinase
MNVRLYLRASTKEQDAERARADLEQFAQEHGLNVVGRYVEKESGASLKRPKLFELLDQSQPGDILLVEQVDRLSRLNAADWDKLKTELKAKRVRVVALDLPTSWQFATDTKDTSSSVEEVTSRMLEALNEMMMDMLAAIARKDYTDRRRRAQQGIEKARAGGRYKGRPEDTDRNQSIIAMLDKGLSWNQIVAGAGCSRSTLARLSRRIRETS